MLKIEEPLKTHIEKNFLIKIENLKLIGVHHNSFDENVIFTLYCDCDKYISIETKKNVIKRVKLYNEIKKECLPDEDLELLVFCNGVIYGNLLKTIIVRKNSATCMSNNYFDDKIQLSEYYLINEEEAVIHEMLYDFIDINEFNF